MAKIMLVEDDNNLREIYGARLLAEGHEIVAAKDGEEALAIAVKEKPDLIISDVMMPRISGFDMLDILRNAPETKETKVIMMTALSQAEDKARADQLGADRYLVKSQVTLEDVAHVVKDVLEGKEETAAADAAMPAGAAVSEPASSEATAPVAAQSSEAEAPAPTPEPAAPTQESTPAVAEPQPETAVPETVAVPVPTPVAAPDPVVDTPSPDPVTPAPAPEPATPTQETVSTPIKVELPPEANDEVAAPALETTPAPVAETAPTEPSAPVIGPNLMEALQHEEEALPSEPNQPTTTTSTPPAEPAVINGAPTVGVVEPTAPPAETPEAEAEPAAPIVDTPGSPLDEGDRQKKLVIQPINDPTKGPDLNALLEAEESKGAVVNPAAASVINPAIEPPTDAPDVVAPAVQPAPASTNEHDIISL